MGSFYVLSNIYVYLFHRVFSVSVLNWSWKLDHLDIHSELQCQTFAEDGSSNSTKVAGMLVVNIQGVVVTVQCNYQFSIRTTSCYVWLTLQQCLSVLFWDSITVKSSGLLTTVQELSSFQFLTWLNRDYIISVVHILLYSCSMFCRTALAWQLQEFQQALPSWVEIGPFPCAATWWTQNR